MSISQAFAMVESLICRNRFCHMQELPGPKSKRLRRAAFTRTVVVRTVADLKIGGLQQRHSISDLLNMIVTVADMDKFLIRLNAVGRITGGLGSVKKSAVTGQIVIQKSGSIFTPGLQSCRVECSMDFGFLQSRPQSVLTVVIEGDRKLRIHWMDVISGTRSL